MAPVTHDHAADSLGDFQRFRQDMNAEILDAGHLVINRFFALDTRAYEDGVLDARTKEMLGLVASLVLRCDDCITYHLLRCHEERVERAQLLEVLSIGLVVGGSIVIPHLRRAVSRWSEIERAGSHSADRSAHPPQHDPPDSPASAPTSAPTGGGAAAEGGPTGAA